MLGYFLNSNCRKGVNVLTACRSRKWLNNHAYANYNQLNELSPCGPFCTLSKTLAVHTPVNINIVCMVVVALLMFHISTLGHISAVFIAHVRDQGKLYQLCFLRRAVWATKCAHIAKVCQSSLLHTKIYHNDYHAVCSVYITPLLTHSLSAGLQGRIFSVWRGHITAYDCPLHSYQLSKTLAHLYSPFTVKMDYNMLWEHEYRPYCNVVTVQETQ